MPPAFQVQAEQRPFQGPSLGLFSSNKRTLIQDVVKFGNDKPPEVNHPRSLTTTAWEIALPEIAWGSNEQFNPQPGPGFQVSSLPTYTLGYLPSTLLEVAPLPSCPW